MSKLTGLVAPAVEGEAAPKKSFKNYEPGFMHVYVKYLPQMPDETQRRYLFVAIDRLRATCASTRTSPRPAEPTSCADCGASYR